MNLVNRIDLGSRLLVLLNDQNHMKFKYGLNLSSKSG